MRTITKTLVAVTASAALVATGTACSSSGGGDKKPVATIAKITGGTTSVALDPGFVTALGTLKLTPGLVSPATMSGTTVTFPITGGNVTVYKKGKVTPYVQGTVTHSGGLTLKGGATTVTLQNFVIDPGNNSKLSGEVLANGTVAVKSAPLFNLDGSTLKTPTVDKATGVATLTGTRVLLSEAAAKLLNTTFKTTALKGGFFIGVATIKANSK
ncbi:hypothetical protein [uncultured Jatrophihabitans sp.]|uniref:hypothetical protein n=1 Tax=uncultured Jatrophihabitans sp. TaxID=1610747 RepID=UPI0035CC89F7